MPTLWWVTWFYPLYFICFVTFVHGPNVFKHSFIRSCCLKQHQNVVSFQLPDWVRHRENILSAVVSKSSCLSITPSLWVWTKEKDTLWNLKGQGHPPAPAGSHQRADSTRLSHAIHQSAAAAEVSTWIHAAACLQKHGRKEFFWIWRGRRWAAGRLYRSIKKRQRHMEMRGGGGWFISRTTRGEADLSSSDIW